MLQFFSTGQAPQPNLISHDALPCRETMVHHGRYSPDRESGLWDHEELELQLLGGTTAAAENQNILVLDLVLKIQNFYVKNFDQSNFPLTFIEMCIAPLPPPFLISSCQEFDCWDIDQSEELAASEIWNGVCNPTGVLVSGVWDIRGDSVLCSLPGLHT